MGVCSMVGFCKIGVAALVLAIGRRYWDRWMITTFLQDCA